MAQIKADHTSRGAAGRDWPPKAQEPVTARGAYVLAIIKDAIDATGVSPAGTQLALAEGLNRTASIEAVLAALAGRNLVELPSRSQHAIRSVNDSERFEVEGKIRGTVRFRVL